MSCVQGEGLAWLLVGDHPAGSVATSPPDASELGISLRDYSYWLHDALLRIFRSSAGPTVLVLTDRRAEGHWLPKDALAIDAAHQVEPTRLLLWHRIALRRPAGVLDPRVPTYSHVLAFGPGRPGRPAPDVIDQGRPAWAHGVGADLAAMVAGWLQEQGAPALLDPFAGQGGFLQAAQAIGLPAYGCELDADRAVLADAS